MSSPPGRSQSGRRLTLTPSSANRNAKIHAWHRSLFTPSLLNPLLAVHAYSSGVLWPSGPVLCPDWSISTGGEGPKRWQERRWNRPLTHPNHSLHSLNPLNHLFSPRRAFPRATSCHPAPCELALCSSHPDATKITRHHTKRPPNETPLATGARDRQPPLAHLVALGLPPTGRKSARKCPPRKRFSGCSTGRWNDGPRGRRIVAKGENGEKRIKEKGEKRERSYDWFPLVPLWLLLAYPTRPRSLRLAPVPHHLGPGEVTKRRREQEVGNRARTQAGQRRERRA